MSNNTKKKKIQEDEDKSFSEIKGVIIIAIGFLTLFAVYTSWAGVLSTLLQTIFAFVFGCGKYLIPLYIIYMGYRYIIGRGELKLDKKFAGITLLVFMILLIFSTIFIKSIDGVTFGKGFNEMMTKIKNSEFSLNGGIITYIISYLLYKFIGAIGSFIVYSVIFVISAIYAFNVSVEKVVIDNRKKIDKKVKCRYARKKEIVNIKDNSDDTKVTRRKNNDFINVVDANNDEDLARKNDRKIKILDFMKNNDFEEDDDEVIDNYIDEEIKKPSNEKKKPITISAPSQNQVKRKQALDESEKDDINNQINSQIQKGEMQVEKKEYIFPDTELLNFNGQAKLNSADKKELIDNASKLEETLGNFNVEAKVVQVTKGPSVTRFELQPSPGVKVSKIVNLADDIALGLAASGVRIEAPIPGKSAIGIEVPNKTQTAVSLREVLESDEFVHTNKKLAFALGKDIGGECVVGDLSKMPHTLIAGATGSGKSVCINSLIISVLFKYSPDEVKLLMVDPKVVELNVYNGIPHLLIPVVTEPKKAAAALNWAVNEMTKRYNLFAEKGVRNMDSYNALYDKGEIDAKLPYIIIIVDELADLMMVCPNDVEDYIGRLAQMARAAGMHLVIATQRPSVDVITGVIKANIPSRISFAVSSQIDSRTILDASGAEKLLGKGDMLYAPAGEGKPVRVQGCFISEEEVEKVINFIKTKHEETNYEESIIEHINNESDTGKFEGGNSEVDELLSQAIEIVVEYNQASTSFIQRKLRIGFNRASRIMEQLEERGIISEKDGSKPRQVLITKEELSELNN